uniref:Uncharacterized protein n=1 Tax=Timema poppense TaxID=170557 RepID=A0A7R9DVB3_TIMPO|nr:unnamed protein product [Timema poppensis]
MCRTFPLSSAVDRTSDKLTPKWNGPWKMTSFLTPVSVLLELVEDQPQSGQAHKLAVRRCCPSSDVYRAPTKKTKMLQAAYLQNGLLRGICSCLLTRGTTCVAIRSQLIDYPLEKLL